MNKEYVRHLRKDYKLSALIESTIHSDPFSQFKDWFKDAIDGPIMEPNAMTLATASRSGKPSSRIVLLKELDNKGFVFFTNYQSSKAKDIEENDQASLLFFWDRLERQVRISGKVEKVSAKESDDYFKVRPRASQIGAWASPQSQEIASRITLDDNTRELEEQFKNTIEIPRPDHWGGYRVLPDTFEYWQGRPSRLHDRLVYELKNGDWQLYRIAP